jgi:polyhydroxyalkanoate synthesis regulator phasin
MLMKAKTFLELVALSANLYSISKENHLMDKLKDLSEDGKDKINSFMSEKVLDENGNEIEFMDRLMMKAQEAKGELEQKIGEMVATFYEKVNIAHVDKIKELEEKVELVKRELALAEARISHLESKEK